MTNQKLTTILGKHALIDLSGCDPKILQNYELVQNIIVEAAALASVRVIGQLEHKFEPEGYSVILALEESHLSIHTWPEYNYVSIDLFSCNLDTDFERVKMFLIAQFRAEVVDFTLLNRSRSITVDQ